VKPDLSRYQSLVFDCDGVVLDSNKVKTGAFYRVAIEYGKTEAEALAAYHVQHGGISRYRKFDYFLRNIIGRQGEFDAELKELLHRFSEEVMHGLMNCPVAPGLERLRKQTTAANWMIISGGDQGELRDLFGQRGLSGLFDGGIFGSPDSKDSILARELKNGNIRPPAVFLGDSRYDYECADAAGLDFIYVSDWSEWAGYESCLGRMTGHVSTVECLCN